MAGSIIPTGASRTIAFESFGVRVRVTADTPEVTERIATILPPDARPCTSSLAEESFGVLADEDGSYRLERGGTPVANRLDLELALMMVQAQVGNYVALHAAERIFVHAGVVAHGGSAIVLPGPPLSGKTTLVLELVRAGAVFYSDAFAVLDAQGRVHPYPATPVPREPGHLVDIGVRQPNGASGLRPLPIGTVVLTSYRPGARWRPARLSPGRGALAVLAQTPAALSRSEEALRVISKAIDPAVILEGERGEARDLVPQLLAGAR